MTECTFVVPLLDPSRVHNCLMMCTMFHGLKPMAIHSMPFQGMRAVSSDPKRG